jgi:hypothetical protein
MFLFNKIMHAFDGIVNSPSPGSIYLPSAQSAKAIQRQLAAARAEGRGLILYADTWFNLKDDSRFALNIPESVRWQILHASTACFNPSSENLNENFSFKHLNEHEFALLYRILNSYRAQGENSGTPSVAIHIYVAQMEKYLIEKCVKNELHLSCAWVEAFEKFNDSNLDRIIVKVKRILSVLKACSNIFKAKSLVLEKQNSSTAKLLFEQLHQEYTGFIKNYIKVSAEMQKSVSKVEKKERLEEKNIVKTHIAALTLLAIDQVIGANPALFADKLKVFRDNANFIIVFMPEGMRILGNKLGIPNIVVCDSYLDYQKKLEDACKHTPANTFFTIRCRNENESGIHQAGVYLIKNENERMLYIVDGGSFDVGGGCHFIANASQAVLGSQFPIYGCMAVRQRDICNCGFFVLKDFKAISRSDTTLKARLLSEATPIVQSLPCVGINPDYKNLVPVKVIKEQLPFLMKSVQSVSQLRTVLSQGNLSALEREKLTKAEDNFLAFDSEKQREVYLYTDINAIKYRLNLMSLVLQ